MKSPQSLRNRTYFLLTCMVLFSSLGNVLLGKGMKEVGEIASFAPSVLVPIFFKIALNSSIWLGMFSLLLFMVSYMMLLSWADLSYVQPAAAIAYGVAPVFGYFMLGEIVPTTRWIGVLFICAGVALVGVTAPSTTNGSSSCE
jgi:drug/metabolite transporter (DMT)-like permease